MRITLNFSKLSRTHWSEYVSRFAFGGSVAALAGVIAKEFGAGVGGLFLAFPAIFPASATLLEKHQEQKMRKAGGHGKLRGRRAAALDAAGASIGAIGLMAFAFVVWKLIADHSNWVVLPIATGVWLVVSVLIWKLFERRPRRVCRRKQGANRQSNPN